MKYSNTTIKELSARYRAVLKKCAIFNAMVVVGVALLSAPAMAGADMTLHNALAESDSVTLAKDMEGVGIFTTKSATIDFAGHTYTGYETSVGSSGTESQLFHLENTGATDGRHKVTLKNGTLNVLPEAPVGANNFNFKMGIQNYVDLTLDNMVVDGTNLIGANSYTLSNNQGDVTIKNTTIIGKADGFAFDVCHYASYTGTHVTLAGGNTILGNIEISVQSDPKKAVLTTEGENKIVGNISNSGIVNIGGDLTLEGSIAGTGSVVFKEGASLTATLNTTKIGAASVEFKGNNKINLIVSGTAADKEYDFITATTLEGEEAVTFDSSLYNLSLTNAGKIALEAKSAGQIAQDTGVSEETAQTLAGIAAVDAPVAAAISEAAQEVLASGDAATVEAELGKLTPNDKNATQQAAIDVATQVAGTVSGRLSSLGASVGRSGGDVKAEYGMWAQGMYNKSKLDGAFRGYTQGLAFGVDTLINDVYTVGIGYAYTATDVKSDRKTKAFGDNFFVYGQYKPSNWYVNGMVSYAHTNYKEEASVFGNAVDAKYDVDTYAGQLAAGYETKIGITPEIGARYIYLKQDTYSNGISTIDADNYDVLTGIAAVKYAAPAMGKEVVVTPEARMAATYDFIADNGQSVVSMPGATAYVAEGERLARFGAEFGVSAKVEYKDLELSLGYDFGVRRDYTSQTGSIKLKYNF